VPLSLLALIPAFAYPYAVGPNVAFRLLALGAVGLWAVSGQRLRLTPISAALVFFLATVALACLNSPDPSLSIAGNLERMDGLVAWATVAGLAMAVSSVARDDSRRARILVGLVAAGIALGLVGLGQVLSVWPLQHHSRATTTLGNADFFGAYALFQAGAATMLLRLGRYRTFAWIGLAFALVSVIDSGSRAAIVGMLAGLLVAGFMLGGNWSRASIAFGIYAALLVVLFGGLVGFVKYADYQLGQPAVVAHNAVTGRLAVWGAVTGLAIEHPLIGTGENSLPYLVQQKPISGIDAEPWFDRAHSWPIDRFVDGGVLGLAAFVSIFVAAFAGLRRQPGAWVWAACLAAYLADNAFGFDSIATYVPLALLLGLIDSRCDGIAMPRFAPAVVAGALAITVPITAFAAVNAADINTGLLARTDAASLVAFNRVFERGGPGQRDARNLLALHAIATKSPQLLQAAIKAEESVIGRSTTQARDMVYLAAVVTAADGAR
jgi:O-antigen ligase